MQAAPPPPFRATPAAGVSDKWQASKKNVLRICGLMRVAINTSDHPSTGPYPNSFEQFTAAQASREDVYALFATWLAKEYDTSNGSAEQKTFLSPDVAVNYLRSLIHIGKAMFGSADDTARYFFTCLEGQTTNPKALWLKGLIRNMHRSMCQRV